MGDEPQRYPIKQGSRKFLICGKRRNRDRPMPQSGSQCDKRIPTRQRQCLTCSTHWSQHLLLQMHSMSITPECYSGILMKNTPSFRKGLGVGYICCFLRFLLLFIFSLPSPILPTDERETTDRTPTQLPANKKCCFLRLHLPLAV